MPIARLVKVAKQRRKERRKLSIVPIKSRALYGVEICKTILDGAVKPSIPAGVPTCGREGRAAAKGVFERNEMAIFALHLVVKLFHGAEPHVGLIEHDLWTGRGAGLRPGVCQVLRVGVASCSGAWCEEEEEEERRQARQEPGPPELYSGDNRDGQDAEDHLQAAAEAGVVQECICGKDAARKLVGQCSVRCGKKRTTTQSKPSRFKSTTYIRRGRTP